MRERMSIFSLTRNSEKKLWQTFIKNYEYNTCVCITYAVIANKEIDCNKNA